MTTPMTPQLDAAAASSLLATLAPSVRVARASDRVYRDECVFSFDSAFAREGIFTNLTTFQSFGAPYVALDRMKTPSTSSVYLHQRHVKVAKEKTEGKGEGESEGKSSTVAAPTRLALGGEGGFSMTPDADKYTVVKHDSIVVFDTVGTEVSRPLVCTGIGEGTTDDEGAVVVPERIQEAITALRQHAGHTVTEEVATWQEERKETKYAEHLVQVENPPKIASSAAAWKCMARTCDKQENLWLNLSDGFIGCGRQNWDGTGGCGEALRHYTETGGIYPLAVKLGTITAEGADVYSYAPEEDDMVTNPKLAQHLTHFGIQIANLKKTDKSMDELQVGLNLNYEFDAITESGKSLVSVSQPGHVGFKNLGNSCYMNSVLQLLLALPELKRRYCDAFEMIYSTCSDHPADDFATQFTKLARGVLTDRYCRDLSKAEQKEEDPDLTTIDLRPITFRGLVGKNHPDFATGQQQDAIEYFQYLMEFMTRSERASAGRYGPLLADGGELAQLPTSSMFKFALEDRVECLTSGKVKYVPHEDAWFQLQIPVEAASNATQVSEYQALEQKRQRIDTGDAAGTSKSQADNKVVPNVPFDACLAKTLAPERIEDFLSTATGKKGLAQKTVRFKNFPRYLLVQMRRFYVSDDWTPKKLDVVVNVPEKLDLVQYLSSGLKEGEELLPEDSTTSASSASDPSAAGSAVAVAADDDLVAQLVLMGFSENGCKRAAIATGNSGAEAAMEWIFSHMEDADFNDPPVASAASASEASSSSESFNAEHVVNLAAMGFSDEQVKCALGQTSHNPDRAAEWLFSHMDDLDAAVARCQNEAAATAVGSTGASASKGFSNDNGEYTLVGFVSHIGRNTNSGHYVCHIKKEGRWVIFNDDKVALSEEPPLGAGYLYLFRRSDVNV